MDGITARVSGGEYFARLQVLLGDMTEPNEAAGQELLMRSQRCFQDEASPGGDPWEPLAPSTIQQRKRLGYWPGGMLQRTGELYRSLTYQAGPDSIELGSNSPIASYHQLGTSKMPARRFLFEGSLEESELPDSWMDAVNGIFNDFIEHAGGR